MGSSFPVLHVGYTLALSGGGYHNPAGYDTYVGLNGRCGRIRWSSNGAPFQINVETTHPDWAGSPKWHATYTHGQSRPMAAGRARRLCAASCSPRRRARRSERPARTRSSWRG